MFLVDSDNEEYWFCWVENLEENVPDYLSSLDAAKALHDAALNTGDWWHWEVKYVNGNCFAEVARAGTDPQPSYQGEAPTPAAAWVSAILRAKAEEME